MRGVDPIYLTQVFVLTISYSYWIGSSCCCTVKDRAIYSHDSASRWFVPHHLVSEHQVSHGTLLIKMSVKSEDAADLDEIPLPVYAEDLAANVREGFDHTCEFVLRCHNNLKTKMDKRFDDLGAQIGALQTIVENL